MANFFLTGSIKIHRRFKMLSSTNSHTSCQDFPVYKQVIQSISNEILFDHKHPQKKYFIVGGIVTNSHNESTAKR